MTCRNCRVTARSFYVWKRCYEELGLDGLSDRSTRAKMSPARPRPKWGMVPCLRQATTSAQPRSAHTWDVNIVLPFRPLGV